METSENYRLSEPLIGSNIEHEINPHDTNKPVDDLEEIKSVRQFFKYAAAENNTLWCLAGPAIITSIAQYSLGAITQVFAGHLTTLELDAVSTENMVIAGLAFGIMVRMFL